MDSSLTAILDPTNPTIQSYREQIPDLLAQAETLAIVSDGGLQDAAELVKMSTTAVRGIKALFRPAKQALDEAKRRVAQVESALLDGFDRADRILRAKITAYHDARRRATLEEQRRREDDERRRREDEQVAQAARLENLAVATGDAHYRTVAEQVLDQPVRQPVIPMEDPKPAGLSFSDEIGVRVVSLGVLVKAVAAGAVQESALTADTAWLRKLALQRAAVLQDGDELVPGVVIMKRPGLRVRP